MSKPVLRSTILKNQLKRCLYAFDAFIAANFLAFAGFFFIQLPLFFTVMKHYKRLLIGMELVQQ